MDRIELIKEMPFRIGFTGHAGHMRIEPLSPNENPTRLRSLPDFVSPPAFMDESPESIKKHIEERYLTPKLDPKEFSPENDGRQWDFEWFDRAKIQLEPSQPRTVIAPVWEMPFRRQKDEQGVWHPKSVQADVSERLVDGQDSGGLPRMPGPSKDFIRGSLNNRPFRPGGLEDSQPLERNLPDDAVSGEWVHELLRGGPAQTLPPGFKEGINLGPLKAYPQSWKVYEGRRAEPESESEEQANEMSLQFDDLMMKAWEQDITTEVNEDSGVIEVEVLKEDDEPESDKKEVNSETDDQELTVLDEILSVASGPKLNVEESADTCGEQKKEAWAVVGEKEQIADRFYELVPDMALDFPFELDLFQKEAIYYLERGESVFVAAHTSAGKTVVAEYAFALATKHCTRAVYTAPIKTISNQKYRDFCGKFDVGLLTGDISLRPEASCLIMTTEILRSMLYRGADIIRDIEWVIFDEVHYVNDVERGVVWEEVIIMLPRHVNIVLLSATVPNTVEFADWIGRTKQKKIRVTGTTKRPVPLEHCLFFSGELYTVCENEVFMPQGLKAAKYAFKRKNSVHGGGTGHGGGNHATASSFQGAGRGQNQKHENPKTKQAKHSGSQKLNLFGGGGGSQNYGGNQNSWGLRRSEASIWLSLINKLSKKILLPVIIFCFSKNRCDKSADNLTSIDLTSSSEKSEIRIFCDRAFSRLKGSDRNLPQVVRVQSLLHRGIGVHHAGLLPIVKEVVEMLFCRGVIKVLFSTETFAMGVNAPAKTVVFDTLRKFDGKEFRQLLPGEYTQMAGRAGRRGLDKIGTVIVMCRDEIPEERDFKHVIVGSATKLESQFRLTYIMILQLLRVEELKVEDMLKRSFAEFHAQKKLPEQQKLLMRKLAQPKKSIECVRCEASIEEYLELYWEAESYSKQMSEAIMQSSSALNFLTTGRVVLVKSQAGQDHLLGVVIKGPSGGNKQYVVLVLKPDIPASSFGSGSPPDNKNNELPGGFFMPPKSKRQVEDEYYAVSTSRKASGAINIKLPHHGAAAGTSYEVKAIDSSEFLSICSRKLHIDQVGLLEDVRPAAYSKAVQQLIELKSKGNKYPPVMDPVKDLKLKDMALVEAYYKWTNLVDKMAKSQCHGCVKLDEHLKLGKELKGHKEEVNALRFQMSDEALQQMPEFQGRIDILKEIGCVDEDLVVQIKGRVACEMNSGEELICTECLFENQLDELEPEEAVALMSAFVFQQRNASEPSLTPKLSHARKRLYDTAIRLGQLQAQFKLQIDPQEYANDNLKFGLVEVVYEWAKGTPFSDICELTDVPEGLIVRTIVRLDETCREFRNAAAIMGNSSLHKKMEEASNLIKRDIVFAASLYITGV